MSFKDHLKNLTDLFRDTFYLNEIRNIVLTVYFLRDFQALEFLQDNFSSSDTSRRYFRPKETNLINQLSKLNAEEFSIEFFSILKDLEIKSDSLRGVFQDLEIAKVTRNRDNALLNLFHEFLNFDFSKIGNYKSGFDELVLFFSEKEGKYQQTSFDTPSSIRDIYKTILGSVETIFDPTCGTGALLGSFLETDNIRLFGQDINSGDLAIAKLRFAFDPNVVIEQRSSFFGDEFSKIKADAVVMTPPFNMSFSENEVHFNNHLPFGLPPRNNANMLWLQVALNHIEHSGKAVVLLSNGSLSSQGREGSIREKMIINGLIEAIISLPAGLLSHTSISSTIWVLSKERRSSDEVLMIDISDSGEVISRTNHEVPLQVIEQIGLCYRSWSDGLGIEAFPPYRARVTRIEEIAKNDFILSPSRYLLIKGLDEYDLSHAVELRDLISRERPISSFDRGPSNIKRLSIKDLATSVDQFEIDVDSLEVIGENKINQVFRGNLLLIAKNGDKLKPSFLPIQNTELGYTLMNVYPFKVNTDRVRVDYLIQELNKEYVQLQVSRFRSGTTIPFIKEVDFLRVKIFLPSLEEQHSAVKNEKEIRFQSLAKLHGFEDEIASLKEQQRKDLGSKKHNIMQHLNNVKSSSNVLLKFLNSNSGVLSSDQIINPKTGVTVLKRFHRLSESIDNVLFYVDNLTNEIDFQKPEIINAHTLIRECVEKGIQPTNARLVDNSDLKTFDVDPLISVSKMDFEELYNNIIQNAELHGFTDPNKQYEFRYSVLIIEGKVEVNFENNGKPFSKGMGTKEAYCTRGEKAGINANTGEGSWKVCQIAQHFGADLNIIDDSMSDFPVGIKLSFNLVQ